MRSKRLQRLQRLPFIVTQRGRRRKAGVKQNNFWGGNDTIILTTSYYQQSRGYPLAAFHSCDLDVAMGAKVVADVETVEAVRSSGWCERCVWCGFVCVLSVSATSEPSPQSVSNGIDSYQESKNSEKMLQSHPTRSTLRGDNENCRVPDEIPTKGHNRTTIQQPFFSCLEGETPRPLATYT